MSLPVVRQRPISQPVYQAARAHGFTELQSRVIGSRLPESLAGSMSEAISPTLSRLDPPRLLPDIEAAVDRIASAVQRGETIAVVTDHDCDGASSHAVIVTALRDVFMMAPINIKSYISHRMREGYGVSDALVDRILVDLKGPALVITADQGSTDEPRIARLREHGIDTVVTDHHEIPAAGVPVSAVACVNPTRSDTTFPDRTIAGCHVAFLVMCAVREELIARRHLPPATPKLTSLSCWVSSAVVADCVSMCTSANNRAIVRFGLYLMNTQPRPCWRALRRLLQTTEPFTAETLAFKVGPLINCSGRMDDAMLSVKFLLSNSEDEAYRLLLLLQEANQQRREVQDKMLVAAMPIARLQAQFGVSGIVIYLPDGHAGVHGIASSRIVDAFGRPTVFFSPKQGADGVVSGSFRSIPGVHIRNALVRANEIAGGDLYLGMGGHSGAAGASLKLVDLERFQVAFRAAITEQRAPETMGPVVETDGAIDCAPDLALLAEIAALEPYGREFPAPVFEGHFTVHSVRPVGDGRHLKIELADLNGAVHGGIWFSAREKATDAMPAEVNQLLHVVYILSANTYRGRTSVDLKVQTARVIEDVPA